MSNEAEKEPFITERDAAEILCRSHISLKRWRRLRNAPPHYIVNGKPYYRRGEIIEWMEARAVRTMVA